MPMRTAASMILVVATAAALQRPVTHSLARRRGTPLLAAMEKESGEHRADRERVYSACANRTLGV